MECLQRKKKMSNVNDSEKRLSNIEYSSEGGTFKEPITEKPQKIVVSDPDIITQVNNTAFDSPIDSPIPATKEEALKRLNNISNLDPDVLKIFNELNHDNLEKISNSEHKNKIYMKQKREIEKNWKKFVENYKKPKQIDEELREKTLRKLLLKYPPITTKPVFLTHDDFYDVVKHSIAHRYEVIANEEYDLLRLTGDIFEKNKIFDIFNVSACSYSINTNVTKHNISQSALSEETLKTLRPILLESNIAKMIKSIFNINVMSYKKKDIWGFIEYAKNTEISEYIISYHTYLRIKEILSSEVLEKCIKIVKYLHTTDEIDPADLYMFNQILPKILKIKDVKVVEDLEISNIITNRLTISIDNDPTNNIIFYVVNAPTNQINTVLAHVELKVSNPYSDYFEGDLLHSVYSTSIGQNEGFFIDTVESNVHIQHINQLLTTLEVLNKME